MLNGQCVASLRRPGFKVDIDSSDERAQFIAMMPYGRDVPEVSVSPNAKDVEKIGKL